MFPMQQAMGTFVHYLCVHSRLPVHISQHFKEYVDLQHTIDLNFPHILNKIWSIFLLFM